MSKKGKISKGLANRAEKNISQELNDTKEEDKKMMGMTYWLPVIIPVIISVAALVISILGLLYQSYYNQADYEYKRDPEFEVSVRVALQTKEDEAERKTYPVIDKFNVDITAKNNIESLYIVSPTFEVTKIDVKYDIEKQLSDYFSQAYKNGKPDIANEEYYGEWLY